MRIGILCHTSMGGSGVLATELAVGLSQQGHDVHIIGEKRPFRLDERVTEIYKDLGDSPPPQSWWGQVFGRIKKSFSRRPEFSSKDISGSLHFHELLTYEHPLLDSSNLSTLRAANTLAGLIDQHKIDLVNAHYVIPHATSALLARDSGVNVKVVTTLHGTDITMLGRDPAFYYTTRHAISASDGVTAVCKFLSKEAREAFNLDSEIAVIQNWVDMDRFKRITDPKARASFAQKEEMICLHVSNFRPVKRTEEVVRAFSKILEQVPARLLLVGDGPEKMKCMELAAELGVLGRIHSIPPSLSVENIFGIADFMFLPSQVEGFPLVALEAMACGAICLASNVGGVGELITDNVNGYLFEEENLKDMGDRAVEVFRDEALTSRIRENALETVRANYTPEKLINKYANFYQYVLG